ncbi:MAG: VWA domain-containing protein [Phycisphaerales bacterium]
MEFILEQPLWLWICLAVVPTAAVALRWFAAMSPLRRWAAILSRAGLVAVLALLLAGLSSLRRTNELAVIAVVDVSGSVQRFYSQGAGEATAPADALTAVRTFVSAAAAKRGGEDYLGVVAFDGASTAIATPSLGGAWDRSWNVGSTPGTNIADALRLARALVPPNASGRIVLFSDGNETMGDTVAAAGEVVGTGLGRSPARIDVVPLTYHLKEEVVVESVDAPPTAPAEATVNVRVVLTASAPSTGTLYLFNEGQRVDLNADATTGRRVSLSPGRNVELVEVALGAGRVHRFRAVYEPDPVDDGRGGVRLSGDALADNNAGEAFTITPGKGSVLLVDGVHGGDEGKSVLAASLRRAGLEVSVVAPEAVPQGLLAIQAYDMILLDNVGAYAVPTEQQKQLASYVRDMGGGLAMIGGPDSFGPGGWKATPVADVLPVLLDMPDRVVAPQAATVLVMDNSGSMRRPVLGSLKTQQEIANESAALAISSMDRNDMVGVIVFNADATVVIPLSQNKDVKGNVEKVRSIGTGGGTDMADGLEEAIREFERTDAEVKQVKTRQVIALTDGKSQREDELPGLVERLKAMNVKVSCIAVGDDADVKMLMRLADLGQGTFYYASNPKSLPKVFLKAVQVVRSPLIREVPFEPVTLLSGSPMTVGLEDPPMLTGMVLTRPRAEPGVVTAMVAPTGEPLLAHWNVGLGQVVAFTSDAEHWASPWMDWPGYERMWAQVIRAASRPPGGKEVRGSMRAAGDEVLIRLDAVNDDNSPRSGLVVPVTVYAPSGEAVEVSLAQASPGVYEGRVRARETGSYIALLKPQQGSRRLSPVIVGATVQEGAEFRALSSNDALLAQVARVGQGRVLDIRQPQNAGLFSRDGIRPAEAVTTLWRPLMIAALALFLLDIAMRRVAWDRWFGNALNAAAEQRAARQESARAAAAERSIAGLRVRAEATDEHFRVSESVVLSDQDAATLSAAARDRRRAEKLARLKPSEPPPQPPPAVGAAEVQGTADGAQETPSLLAAKRRAARRFDEE